MRLLGFEISRANRGELAAKEQLTLLPVRSYSSWFGNIMESFPGAWQRNIVAESRENILRFSAVYACVTRIAGDIAKLRLMLMARERTGIWTEIDYNSPFFPVLAKPNRYQTRVQFIRHWVTSKLLHGNTYVLKERDGRGMVSAMYVLDPLRVTPLVGEDGSVFYRLQSDYLSGLTEENGQITVPASEIIHDRMNPLWHPLVGVSPIYACGAAATQGIRIQANSARFFENMSMPSGQLTAPGTIEDATALRLKQEFETKFSGNNIGRFFVSGDGLKYERITMPAVDAQLIEQQRWTVDDVARAFHMPLHKIGAGAQNSRSNLTNVGQLNQEYYNETLQDPIEEAEALLDEGLELPSYLTVEFDLDGLLRMDPLSRAETASKYVQAGVLAPNEARLKENLPPAAGGDTPYLQQQNYSLAALAKRDARDDPFATSASAGGSPDAGKASDGQAPAAGNQDQSGGAQDVTKLLRRIATQARVRAKKLKEGAHA
jgi:HK97 family phage portal protein